LDAALIIGLRSSAFVSLAFCKRQIRWYPILIALSWMTLSPCHSQMIIVTGFSFNLTCNLAITASMVYYLHTQYNRVKQYVNLRCGMRSCKMTVALHRTISAITTLVLISTGALALFVRLHRPSPTRRPNSFSAYSRFYASSLSVSVSTVILISTSC